MHFGKVFRLLWFFIVPLLFLSGCGKKKREKPLPETMILLPYSNSLFSVPGRFSAHVRIKSATTVKANITNSDFIPVFGDVVFEPVKYEGDTLFTFYLELQKVDPDAVYYFHVRSENGFGVKNDYVRISLVNKTPVFNNILFVRNKDNRTEVVDNENQVVAAVTGDFEALRFVPYAQVLFLETNRPAALRCFHYPQPDELWHYMPQTAVSLHGLWVDEQKRRLYCPRSDGSIYGFDFSNGNLRFASPYMTDTVPSHIVATADYLFGEFKTLHNDNTLWIAFFNSGGAIIRTRQTDYASRFVLPYVGNMVALVQNRSSGSVVLFYDMDKNEVKTVQNIDHNKIVAACSGPQKTLFVATQTKLFMLDDRTVREVPQVEVNHPLMLKFHEVDNRLYLLEQGRFKVFHWPDYSLTSSQAVDTHFVGFQTIYRYE